MFRILSKIRYAILRYRRRRHWNKLTPMLLLDLISSMHPEIIDDKPSTTGLIAEAGYDPPMIISHVYFALDGIINSAMSFLINDLKPEESNDK